MKNHPAFPSPASIVSFSWYHLALAVLLISLSPVHAGGESGAQAGTDEQVVYRDQGKPSTQNWSDSATMTAAGDESKNHVYRGPFQAQPVSLSLSQLPKHGWVRVRFNLYIVGSWDGSNPVWGPDLWSLQVRGGQRLFFTTFSNMGDFVNNNVQSFPDEYPWGKHKAWTGSWARNAIGFPKGHSPSTRDTLNDGVYPIEVIFPQSNESLILDFAGIYNDPPTENQSWVVGDLEVATMSAPPSVDENELPGLWEDLASDEPMRANKALWKMVTAGGDANSFITDRVAQLEAEASDSKPGTPPVTGLNALRLHRAQRIIQLLSIQGPNPSFRIDHLLPEYFRDF